LQDALVLNSGAVDEIPVVLDPYLRRFMHDYQLEGVQFLYDCVCGRKKEGMNGCILADEM
jgi:hypothetical protein